ncbi:uncharacterized protein LOC123308039 [Coccinella septempunctata]|uniref:uncharacterized protein LOC123308039 n=1 Tax=Coccinella septempunctata TaxID=41139 RepID=UPI001D08B5A1|nr:uncharacterized protein LOC123308039 [Coccinella septempunctata]
MIKKRGVLKAKLTLFEKHVKSVESSISSSGVDRSVIIELEQRVQDLEDLIPNFEDIQSEIDYSIEENEDEQLLEREEFYNRYYTSTAKAKKLIEKFKPADSDNSSIVIQANSSQNSQNNGGIKLPDIKLPKFDGSFQTWLDFRDIFESLIHDNSSLNEIQKFHYLRASLVGSATQVIRALEFSASNYKIAWKTLCERFNNNNLLVQNHISAIFNLEKITTESAEKIRNLSDNLFKHLSTLKHLGEPTDHWDTLIIYICSSRLDSNSSREWERLKAKQSSSCSLEHFKNFLKERADLLENMEMNFEKSRNESRSANRFRENKDSNRETKNSYTRNLHSNIQNKNENKKPSCFYCKSDHSLFYCGDFLKLSVPARNSKVKEMKLCINCLRPNHISSDCKWSGCRVCGEKHNSILHKETENSNLALSQQRSEEQTQESSVQVSNCNLVNIQTGILPTAKVQIRDVLGNYVTARALLDCGSQSSFITSEFHDKLKIPKSKVNLSISGIAEKTSHSSFRCNLKIRALSDHFSFDLNCFILDKITNQIPGFRMDHLSLNIPNNITLADPEFYKTQKIDLLIGSDAFWNLLCPEKIHLMKNGPLLQKTKVGWVVAGPFDTYSNNTICNLSSHRVVQDQLARFWEVEEISTKKPLSSEEELCEQYFTDSLKISPGGRYIVSYPFKSPTSQLGDSREIAIKRFANLERKLIANQTLRNLYTSFLREYAELGHMTEVTDSDSTLSDQEYVMPHHGVLRDTSLTTRLRVVFNASSPSSSGVSLNDLQMNGPVVQSDILSIILRFRMRAIALSGDIKMMYRQILVDPKQRKLQRIVWRSNPSEINHSFYRIVKQVQRESYPSECSQLEARRELSTASKILNLRPFLDSLGLIRVGGRLSNSSFSYSKKHPTLLPASHALTKLVFRFEHENLLHAGPQLLLASIREQFWPISGRSIARQTVRNCVKCARYSTTSVQPIMGDLPAARVQQSLPFVKVGVDYAGPFLMKDRRGRGCKVIKCWVAVFVCFTTRAIHLELILSLSTDDFLQAFHRFVSRRGMPAEVFSDNGTTFVKANKDLQSLFNFFKEQNLEISKAVTDMGITWHFIPVNSPHFGGIWEAGVKSLKNHLKRVLGSYTFFFFDFQTLLVRIEAVLNSRPICPLTSCPNDLSPLTPAHFLLGRAGTAVPEGTVMHLPENRLSQFQLVQKVYEQFWSRWQREYVSELQTRQKWTRNTGSLNIGQLVLIKEDNLPPMRWRMGRILELFSGKDGIARVARIKTTDGIVSRALVKLCPLPVESSPEDLSRRGACTVPTPLPAGPPVLMPGAS